MISPSHCVILSFPGSRAASSCMMQFLPTRTKGGPGLFGTYQGTNGFCSSRLTCERSSLRVTISTVLIICGLHTTDVLSTLGRRRSLHRLRMLRELLQLSPICIMGYVGIGLIRCILSQRIEHRYHTSGLSELDRPYQCPLCSLVLPPR